MLGKPDLCVHLNVVIAGSGSVVVAVVPLTRDLTRCEIENPYQSPIHSISLIRIFGFRTTSRLKFLYVIALIFSLSLVVTFIIAHRNVLSSSTTCLFLGLTAAGPFIALAPLYWGVGPLTMQVLIVATLVFVATISYLVRPNILTFTISLVGAVAWVTVAPVVIVLLPELGIRV
ncbi:MAG: hypothetical protein ACI814_003649 [Mariniblastus sp.]|jgi:hypothetical protein